LFLYPRIDSISMSNLWAGLTSYGLECLPWHLLPKSIQPFRPRLCMLLHKGGKVPATILTTLVTQIITRVCTVNSPIPPFIFSLQFMKSLRSTLIAHVVTKVGIKTQLTKLSIFLVMAVPNGGPSGVAKPNTKGPKRAKSPIRCVA